MANTLLSNCKVTARNDSMVCCSQADVDCAFADLEHLLALERPVPLARTGVCVNCDGSNFVYAGPCSGHPGSRVCDDCGVVESGNVYWETMYGKLIPTKSSNYKRIHHWHERISQLLLLESHIPPDKMLQIGERLCDGTYTVINKDVVREVLRSLNMQIYIEKWLQIIHRISGIQPPCPGPLVVQQLDCLFNELQRPFDSWKTPTRKNFLNYNYVFCRLFQKMGVSQFSMFFPLIKSKSKLKSLDDMWHDMVSCIDWPVTELERVPAFAVRLESPALLLQRLGSQCVEKVPAVIQTEQEKTESRMWGRLLASIPTRRPKQHRRDPLAPEFRMLGLTKRRLR